MIQTSASTLDPGDLVGGLLVRRPDNVACCGSAGIHQPFKLEVGNHVVIDIVTVKPLGRLGLRDPRGDHNALDIEIDVLGRLPQANRILALFLAGRDAQGDGALPALAAIDHAPSDAGAVGPHLS